MNGPTLKGQRVTLRELREVEAPELLGFVSDVEITRFMGRTLPPSLVQEQEWVQQMSQSPNDLIWCIEIDGRLVGTIGLHQIDWANQSGELGAMLGDQSIWNQGIMKEAGQLARDYLFTQQPFRKLRGGYLEGNGASQRAQERAGFREVGRWYREHFRDGQWRDHVLMELWREDWEKLRQG